MITDDYEVNKARVNSVPTWVLENGQEIIDRIYETDES